MILMRRSPETVFQQPRRSPLRHPKTSGVVKVRWLWRSGQQTLSLGSNLRSCYLLVNFSTAEVTLHPLLILKIMMAVGFFYLADLFLQDRSVNCAPVWLLHRTADGQNTTDGPRTADSPSTSEGHRTTKGPRTTHGPEQPIVRKFQKLSLKWKPLRGCHQSKGRLLKGI